MPWSQRHRFDRVLNVEDARRRARRTLPPVLFDFVDGGADDELTLAENRRAFARVAFLPRLPESIARPCTTVSVLGSELSLPVVLAPCGAVRLVHPDGDRAMARAAGSAGTAFVLAMASATPLEEVAAAAGGPAWFQLYPHARHEIDEQLLERAGSAGFGALFVTLDTPVQGNRERDRHRRVRLPLTPTLRNAVRFGPQLASRPRWTLGYVRDGFPTSFGNVPPAAAGDRAASTGVTWSDLAWLRRAWSGRLVLKGILTPEDARRAADLGADGVVVSNHGGRQLDGTPASLAALPAVRKAVGSGLQVLLDGGVRRGGDAVKAIALGADAVMIGRPYLYGLAIGGQAGVEHILAVLRTDIERTLALLGCNAVSEVGAEQVDPAGLLA